MWVCKEKEKETVIRTVTGYCLTASSLNTASSATTLWIQMVSCGEAPVTDIMGDQTGRTMHHAQICHL
jgi:hypothetical protein